MPFFSDNDGVLEADTSMASPLDVQENPENIGLLSAIQVLAEDSSLIHKMFVKRDEAKCIYAIRLFKNGREEIIIIDDFMPTDSSETPLHMEDSYLWVFLSWKIISRNETW